MALKLPLGFHFGVVAIAQMGSPSEFCLSLSGCVLPKFRQTGMAVVAEEGFQRRQGLGLGRNSNPDNLPHKG